MTNPKKQTSEAAVPVANPLRPGRGRGDVDHSSVDEPTAVVAVAEDAVREEGDPPKRAAVLVHRTVDARPEAASVDPDFLGCATIRPLGVI